MHQLGVLSLLLRFDKYNFKRSSQTALAGRLHNAHNNPTSPGSSCLVHLPLPSTMSVCARVFVSLRASWRLPSFCAIQSGCIEEPFGPHFYKCIPLLRFPSICLSHVMPDWPQHPYKRSKGRQNSLVSWQPVCHQLEQKRGARGGVKWAAGKMCKSVALCLG